jgi:hypothetical protein
MTSTRARFTGTSLKASEPAAEGLKHRPECSPARPGPATLRPSATDSVGGDFIHVPIETVERGCRNLSVAWTERC